MNMQLVTQNMETNFKTEVTVGGVISYICAFTHIHTKSQPTDIKYLSRCQWKLLESLKSQEICCVWVMAPQAHTDNLAGCLQEIIRDIGQAC